MRLIDPKVSPYDKSKAKSMSKEEAKKYFEDIFLGKVKTLDNKLRIGDPRSIGMLLALRVEVLEEIIIDLLTKVDINDK